MDNKKIVKLDDDNLDMVAGGVNIGANYVMNKDTGVYYKLLVDPMEAFTFVSSLGDVSEDVRISELFAQGMITNF